MQGLPVENAAAERCPLASCQHPPARRGGLGRGVQPVRRHSLYPGATSAPVLDAERPETSLREQPAQVVAPQPLPSTLEEQPFDWARQWWPLAVERDLDRSVPTPRQLLGTRLVLWRDGDEWRCMEDKCPHRLAPLSEGRVEVRAGKATLMCSYHGWEFSGDGSCVRVPQAQGESAHAAAVANSRSCAVSRPCQVHQGLVYVWGEGGPNRWIEAAVTPPTLIPALEHPSPEAPPRSGNMFYRELPYGWDVLTENLADPAHLPFAHHNNLGNREAPDAGIVDFGAAELLPGPQGGVTLPFSSPLPLGQGLFKRRWTFRPPHLLTWENFTQDGHMWMCLAFHCVPMAAGRSAVIFNRLSRPAYAPAAFNRIIALTPLVLEHRRSNLTLDTDSAILYHQERIRAAEQRAYFMPTVSDRAVIALNSWLDRQGGGGPLARVPALASSTRDPAQEEVLPQTVLLDRYEQHTRHCKTCTQAVSMLSRVRAVAIACAALCALWLCAALGQGARVLSPKPVLLAAGALAALGLVRLCQALRQEFFYKPWSHARNA